MQTTTFFRGLQRRLDDARNAKRLDLELDRHLARRFNALDYLRTDELGLSRIIADFLTRVPATARALLFCASC